MGLRFSGRDSGAGGRIAWVCVAVCLSMVLAPVGTATAAGPNDGGASAPTTGVEHGTAVVVNGTEADRNVSSALGVQSGGKVDVVFVVDDTGSMGNNIDGVRNNVREFANDIESEGIDAQYALITFSREPEVDQELTGDPGDIETALDEVSVSGGIEDNFDALELATERDFRPGAQRVIVDITDEDADLGPTDLRMPEVIDMLEPYSAYVAVSEDPPSTCADPPTASCKDKRALAGTLDDGSYVDLGQVDSGDSDFGDILDVVTETVTEVAVQENGVSPDIEYVDTEVNRTTVTPGERVQVNVTAVNEGDGAGEYRALFKKNLQLGETQRGFLDPGEEVDLSATLPFEDPGQYRVFVRQEFVATVDVQGLSPAENAAEFLDIEGTYVTRDHVWPGESYSVGAVVRNSADGFREFEVSFSRADGTETPRTFELGPDETRRIEVSRTASADRSRPGARAYYFQDDLVGNVTLHTPERPKRPGTEDTVVTDGYVPRDEVEPGETYEVVAVVRSTSGSGDAFVQFSSDGVETTSEPRYESISGGIDTVTYEATAPEETGLITWEVSDGVTAGTVRVVPEAADDEGDDGSDAPGGGEGGGGEEAGDGEDSPDSPAGPGPGGPTAPDDALEETDDSGDAEDTDDGPDSPTGPGPGGRITPDDAGTTDGGTSDTSDGPVGLGPNGEVITEVASDSGGDVSQEELLIALLAGDG